VLQEKADIEEAKKNQVLAGAPEWSRMVFTVGLNSLKNIIQQDSGAVDGVHQLPIKRVQRMSWTFWLIST